MDAIYFDVQAVEKLKLHIKECQAENKTIVLLCDENTHKHCLHVLEQFLQIKFNLDNIICLSAGEESKSIENAVYVWQKLIDSNVGKDSVLICLGGGVIGDLGGFVAATYKRGIDNILIPTTLLAQTDAALGRKNAINLSNAKNQVGLFTIAKGVYIFPQFLSTLPQIEILSGLAEMFKHGLIAQRSYWNKLKQIDISNKQTFHELVFNSVNIKMQICQQDMFEQNIRKKLNFGHSIGHAIESYCLSRNHPIPHGQAVAEGIIAESYISYDKRLIERNVLIEISKTIRRFFQPVSIPASEYHHVLQFTAMDKKRQQKHANFTLLTDIGSAIINQDVTEEQALHSLTFREA